MPKLTNSQLGRALREGLPKAAGHDVVTISVYPDAPKRWRAENAKGQQRDFDDESEMMRWLGAWDD